MFDGVIEAIDSFHSVLEPVYLSVYRIFSSSSSESMWKLNVRI